MAQFTLTLALADFIAMGKVIAVANQKGGTGKTSCAVHLLHWCSQRGSTLGSPCKLVQVSSSVTFGDRRNK